MIRPTARGLAVTALFAALVPPTPIRAEATAGAMAECPLHAQHTQPAHGETAPAPAATHDAALAARGDRHMGFPQAATTHHFRLTTDGGTIEVTGRDPGDEATVAQVRAHLRHIATAFAEGDFSIPRAVHAQAPPGTEAMRAAGTAIEYGYAELPAGGRVRLVARTPEALAAVHEFLRYQITDHRTGDPVTPP
jgi:hypothetical protein